MLIEIILFLCFGVLVGIFTGLIPGVHINMIGTLIASSSLFILAAINPIYLIVFIVSMSITHVFIDFIPSIFLGAPESGTELSVLPGHEMLKQGLGFQAVNLAALGCLIGLFIFVLMIFPLSLIAKAFSGAGTTVQKIIPIVLILVSLNVVFSEKRKFSALLAFALSGILGLIVLNLDLKEPLVPLLTGLFGASSVLLSIKSKTKIGKQSPNKKVKVKKLKPILASTIFSPLSLFFPALSSGQIAVMGNRFAKADKKEFLFMLGVINILAMSFSFLALFLISKTRTGSAAVIKELIGVPEINVFVLIVLVALISGVASFFIVKFLSKKFLLILEKANYTKVSYSVLVIMSIVTLFISGFFGFLVLLISAATGIYCIMLGVSRINMMGCLLLPTIVFYLMI
ncbi:tripartite tricarboxylate transporter permease [Candidatus Pacearchaeota archaeon]|nr:tripartite tricarboxylate transporter permease [Candidatus Pacearchaeota archaeon]